MDNNSYKKYVNQFDQDICFIISSGTSLYDLYKHNSFQNIFNYYNITVNTAFLLTDNYSKMFWVSCDCSVRRWNYWNDIVKSDVNKLLKYGSWSKYTGDLEKYDFFEERNDLDFRKHGAIGCSTGPAAIDLGIQFGFKKIILFGFDGVDKKGKTHFWQYFSQKERPYVVQGTKVPLSIEKKLFKYNSEMYYHLNEFALNKRIKIYNCNKYSTYDYFEFINYDEVFNLID